MDGVGAGEGDGGFEVALRLPDEGGVSRASLQRSVDALGIGPWP